MKFLAFFLTLLLLASAPVMSQAAGSPELWGLQGFEVLTVYANPFDPFANQTSESIKNAVLDKLHEAGLPVKTREEAAFIPGRPRLLVLMAVLPDPFCGDARLYEIEIDVQEDFSRVREPVETRRKEIWSRHFNYLADEPGKTADEIMENALYALDHFIEEYRSANPANYPIL